MTITIQETFFVSVLIQLMAVIATIMISQIAIKEIREIVTEFRKEHENRKGRQ